jgi:uncharacterized protein YbjQ (UPF0145 family)
MESWLWWLVEHKAGIAAVTILLFVLVVIQRVREFLRRRSPAGPLNPRLQRYAGKNPAETEADRLDAAKIIATSSTGSVAGYEIVRQIEAVFVEGYRSPDDAVLALKVAAGRLGASAIINLSQQRSTAGKCTCQGDAVVVRAIGAAGGAPSSAGGTP